MKIKAGEWGFIACLVLFAAGLRILGMAYGRPDPQMFPSYAPEQRIHANVSIHPDEFLFISIPLRMLVLRQFNPDFFHNPSFLINANLVTFALTGADRAITPEMRLRVDERTYAPFHLYIIGRLYSALGGVLATAAVYATARRLSGRFGAAVAGLLTAVSLPLVQHSHYTTTSSLAAGFAALAICASLCALQASRRRWWLFALAGTAAGFAAGNRYNAAAVVIVVFLSGLLLLQRSRTRRTFAMVMLGWACIPAVFVFSTPHVIFDPEAVWQQFVQISQQYLLGSEAGRGISPNLGLLYEYRYLFVFGLGIPASLMLIAGLMVAWRSRRRERRFLEQDTVFLFVVMLLIYLLAYSLVVLRTVRPDGADQLLVPVLPAFALWVGLGAQAWYQRLPQPKWLLGPLSLLLLVSIPLVSSVQFVRQLTQADTRQLLEQWVDRHVPYGMHMHLVGPYNIALDESHYVWSQNYGGDFKPVSEIIGDDVDYVVLSDAFYYGELRAGELYSPQYLQQIADYVATFSSTLTEIARIERPAWTGYDWMGHTPSYWHNPSLIVYCVNPASCAAVRR